MMRNARLVLVLVAGLVLGACQVEERQVGPAEVRPATPATTLISVADITHESVHIGVVKTYRYDGTGRTVNRVLDHKGRAVGYITDGGQAYRHTAHGGADLVAGNAGLRENVAALLGRPLDRLTLTVDKRIKN